MTRIVYIFHGAEHYALRFLTSYHDNPPGIEHESIVVLNGVPETEEIRCLFSSLRNVRFLERDNSGMDIGGYQDAAAQFPCELMVFLGGSSYFKGTGWLLRMEQAFQKRGPGLFGVMGHKGCNNVWPHVRTTGFWTQTDLMNAYPHRVTRADQRYNFEHGQDCFANWIKARGLKTWVVTWLREHLEPEWDSIENGFHRGNQSALLCGDRLTCPPFYPTC